MFLTFAALLFVFVVALCAYSIHQDRRTGAQRVDPIRNPLIPGAGGWSVSSAAASSVLALLMLLIALLFVWTARPGARPYLASPTSAAECRDGVVSAWRDASAGWEARQRVQLSKCEWVSNSGWDWAQLGLAALLLTQAVMHLNIAEGLASRRGTGLPQAGGMLTVTKMWHRVLIFGLFVTAGLLALLALPLAAGTWVAVLALWGVLSGHTVRELRRKEEASASGRGHAVVAASMTGISVLCALGVLAIIGLSL